MYICVFVCVYMCVCVHLGVQYLVTLLLPPPPFLHCASVGNLVVHRFLASTVVRHLAAQPLSPNCLQALPEPLPAPTPVVEPSFTPFLPLHVHTAADCSPRQKGELTAPTWGTETPEVPGGVSPFPGPP